MDILWLVWCPGWSKILWISRPVLKEVLRESYPELITFFARDCNSDSTFADFFLKSLGSSAVLCLDESNGFLLICP